MRPIAAGMLLCMSSASLAAGDAPIKLDRRQATAEYARVRMLLENEGRACPTGQSPLSGLVTDGAAPVAGSRTTSITFDKGAVVRIVRNWSGGNDASASSTFTVTCDPSPATHTVSVGEIVDGSGPVDHAERCRQIAESLRRPPPADCPIGSIASGPAPTGGISDGDYIQQQATSLNERIAGAIASGKLSDRRAAALRLTVGRVQTLAGNLQAKNGSIPRSDADRMNEQLTDVERELPLQR